MMPATSGDVALTVRRLPDGRDARRWLLDTQLHLRRHGSAAWLIRILWLAGLLVALAACLGVAELRGRWEPSRTDILQLRRGRVFVALNLYNSEDVLREMIPQLRQLAQWLGPDRFFLSVYESSSKDRTPEMLHDMGNWFSRQQPPYRHNIVTANASDWRDYCEDAGLGVRCAGQGGSTAKAKSLRDAEHEVRIPIMALLRNKAMAPLQDAFSFDDDDAGDSATRTRVLFINDVLFRAADAARLILNRGELRYGMQSTDPAYDMVCALDFEELGLYDTWVARDIQGDHVSQWYPFVGDKHTRALMRTGQPLRVYACWNGMVAIDAAAFIRGGVTFRSWRLAEPTSPHPLAVHDTREVFGRNSSTGLDCAVSECHLICKDLWAMGRSRIYINPAVRVFYSRKAWCYHTFLMPAMNMFLGWLHTPFSSHPQFDSANAGSVPPRHVACGLRHVAVDNVVTRQTGS